MSTVPAAVNLPNALTLSRVLVLPPLVAVILAHPHGSWLAVGLFAAVVATDALDGHIARSRGIVTTFGKVLDPIADKLLVLSVLGALLVLHRIPVWVVATVLARELAVSGLRALAGRSGVVVPASRLGKAKMAAQALAIALLLGVADPATAPVQAAVYTMVAVTVLSGLDYALNLRARGERVRRAAGAD